MDIYSLNRLPYHRRLFLWLLGYSLLLMGCFVIFQTKREKQFKAEEINSQLQLINTYIQSELSDGVDIKDVPLREIHPFEDLRITIINPEGTVVYDNSLDSLPHINHLNRQEIAAAVKNGTGYTIRRHSESTGATYFYSASKSPDGQIIRTAVPYSISLSELLDADYGFLWFLGSITFVMCTLGFFATHRLGQHILRLNRFAENVEKGQKISDTEPFQHDELGDISNHIVRLYARLQQANADRNKEHRAAIHEQQEKERIKKQLTDNINHELKTPVAAIKLCLETLLAHEELPQEKRRDFLQRSLANTDRLKKLLEDVSQITRMDDGREQIIKSVIDINEIIADVCTECRHAAQSKGIEIKNGTSGELPVLGNQSLLLSVFHNLIDNAIAYSGGTEIIIRVADETDDKVTLLVADNGNGVGDEHLPRLFERFYRIDKGRSRAAGGTGLGLSIVKNAILLHGGNITVANRPNGGLAFRITLPKH